MEACNLKSMFPAQLLARGFTADQAVFIMRYWPNQEHFEVVRCAQTCDELEKIRRWVDYKQACHDLEQEGRDPTAENLRPLLHNDMVAHINDTRDGLPGTVVKAKKRDAVRHAVLASVYSQILGQSPSLASVDFSQPQDGLKLRNFRKRHPRKQQPQCGIVAEVSGFRQGPPSTDERPHTGKTPVRKTSYDDQLNPGTRLYARRRYR